MKTGSTVCFESKCCGLSSRDLQGVIITLDEDGHLQCFYLGTDPAMFTTPTAEARDLDYNEVDGEMKRLHKVIKEQQSKIGNK